MPRPEGKAKKIAENILGELIKAPKKVVKKKKDKRLQFENEALVR